MNKSLSEKIAAELPPLNEVDQQLRRDPLGRALDKHAAVVASGYALAERQSGKGGAIADEARVFRHALEAADAVLVKVWRGYNEPTPHRP